MRSLAQVVLIKRGGGNYHPGQGGHAALKVRPYAVVSALWLLLWRFEGLARQVVLAVFVHTDVVQDATLDVQSLLLDPPLRLSDTG